MPFVFYSKIISNKIKETQEIQLIKDYQTKVCLCMSSITKTNSAKTNKPPKKLTVNNKPSRYNNQKVELNLTGKILKKHLRQKMLIHWFRSNNELNRRSNRRISLIIRKIFWNSLIVMKSMPNWWKYLKKEKYFMRIWKKKIKIATREWSRVLSSLRIKVLNQCKEVIWIMSIRIKAAINRM